MLLRHLPGIRRLPWMLSALLLVLSAAYARTSELPEECASFVDEVGYPEETCFLMEEEEGAGRTEDEKEDGIGDYQRCESRCADRRCPAGGGRSRPVAARCGGGLLCCCGGCRELEEGGARKLIRWRGGPVGARDEDEREKRKRRKRRKKKNNRRRKKKKGGRKKKGKRRKGGKNRHRKKRKNKSKGHRLAAGGVDKGKQEKKHGEDDKGQDLTEHGQGSDKANGDGSSSLDDDGGDDVGGVKARTNIAAAAKTKPGAAKVGGAKKNPAPKIKTAGGKGKGKGAAKNNNRSESSGKAAPAATSTSKKPGGEPVVHAKEEEGDDAEDCKDNIVKKYPDAECSRTRDKDECRARCEEKGNAKCAGSQGEIHKLNCKGESPDAQGLITCCCSIRCEAASKTRTRLNAEFESKIGDSTGICVDVTRDQIKPRLNEVCKSRDEVFVARKYCMEDMKGAYFCVKNGHCFGQQCKGCIKHECEAGGNKTEFNPPKEYMEKHLRLKDFDKNVAVNVDDMKDTEKVRQWCTELEDRKKCSDTCKAFGDRMCHGQALKYDHDDFCRRGEDKCRCCCQPVCKAGPDAAGGDLDDGGGNHTSTSTLQWRKKQKQKQDSLLDIPPDQAKKGKAGASKQGPGGGEPAAKQPSPKGSKGGAPPPSSSAKSSPKVNGADYEGDDDDDDDDDDSDEEDELDESSEFGEEGEDEETLEDDGDDNDDDDFALEAEKVMQLPLDGLRDKIF